MNCAQISRSSPDEVGRAPRPVPATRAETAHTGAKRQPNAIGLMRFPR
jgi:hypothetical protein